MSIIIIQNLSRALPAVCCLAMALPVRAQSLTCFTLTPPEQILQGVKRIAVLDDPAAFADSEGGVVETVNIEPGMTIEQVIAAKGQPISRTNVGPKVILTYKDMKMIFTDGKLVDVQRKTQIQFADSGRRLADMIIAALLEKDRGVKGVGAGFLSIGTKEGKSFQKGAFTNIFTVVERNELQRVIEELQLGQSGLVNDSTTAQVGKLLGVDAIIIVSVHVAFEWKWVSVSATMRIIHVETGQVIGSQVSQRVHDQKGKLGVFYDPSAPGAGKKKVLSGLAGGLINRANESIGGEPANTVTSPEASVDKCLKDIVNDLTNYFAPHFKEQELEFAKIEGERFKRMAEVAEQALKSYDLNIAYLQYAAIAEQDAYNHAAHFNLGLLHEAVGNYKKAKERYDLAYNLKSKEDKYREARERLAKQVEYWDALKALGVVLEEREFQVSREEMAAAATSARIETKKLEGAVYHEIKAAPHDSSETIARVPGEIELTMLESVDGWYKVRLPDGKEGYLLQEKGKVMK